MPYVGIGERRDQRYPGDAHRHGGPGSLVDVHDAGRRAACRRTPKHAELVGPVLSHFMLWGHAQHQLATRCAHTIDLSARLTRHDRLDRDGRADDALG